jgi:Spy/CpxP family protein refolding chaperone
MKKIKITIATLFLMLLSTTLAIAGPGFGRGAGSGPCGERGFRGSSEDGVRLGPGPVALIAINLTDEQQDQLEQLQDEYGDLLESQRDKIKDLHENLNDLAEEEGVAKGALIGALNDIRDSRNRARELRREYGDKLHDLLTAEQLANLVRIKAERFQKRGNRWNR